MFESMLPLLAAQGRAVYAPDTLGFGDSCRAAQALPSAADFAEAAGRVIDALGLDMPVDLFGSHTGAHIACELAIQRPDGIRRVILDGIGMFSEAQKADMLANYNPAMKPDMIGGHMMWAWHFVRDQTLFFPYYHRDTEHRRPQPMPPADVLHRITVDVLKALETYHLGYRAAFSHADRERLPLMTQPVLAMADTNDPLWVGVEQAFACLRHGRQAVIEASFDENADPRKAALIGRFLDAEDWAGAELQV